MSNFIFVYYYYPHLRGGNGEPEERGQGTAQRAPRPGAPRAE